MKRDFLWGAALSNVQAEGAYLEDGKGLNVYDTLVVTPEKGIVPMFCDTAVAADHYHHYKEDIALFAEMGFKAYRMSISWARIFPHGDDAMPNPKGIQFYHDVFAELKKYAIEPIVTISHSDIPLAVGTRYHGWVNKQVIDLYVV